MLSAALRVPGLVGSLLTSMVQEDERGLGGWQAEWEVLPDIVQLTAGAVHQLATIMPRLEIDAERMRKNLDLTQGLIFSEAISLALAEKIGKAEAHELVQAACAQAQREKRSLRAILGAHPTIAAQLSSADLDRLFDPHNYLGAAERFISQVADTSRASMRNSPASKEASDG